MSEYTPYKMKGPSLYRSPAKTTGTQEFPEGELSPEQRGKAINRHNTAYPEGHTEHSGQPQDTKTSPTKQKSDFDKQKGKITTYGKHDDPKRKDIGKDVYYKKDGTKISSDIVDEGELSKVKKDEKGRQYVSKSSEAGGGKLYLTPKNK